tara:strand:+ start:344 stop:718 length:375 start_codon:yes stop_codon:yes gene_type:complete
MSTIEKITKLVETGKVYEYAGRCWFTCYMAWTKLTKQQKKETLLVEGTVNGGTHYWLNVNGVVVDPHYKLVYDDLNVEEDLDYKEQKQYDLSTVKLNKELYEERPTVNYLGREKWSKVHSLNLD